MTAPSLLFKKLNHYQVLGIPHSATPLQIKSAYFQLAKKYHPDTSGTGCAESFKIVNEAYETLFDVNKRSAYDASIHIRSSVTMKHQHQHQQQANNSSGGSGSSNSRSNTSYAYSSGTRRRHHNSNYSYYEHSSSYARTSGEPGFDSSSSTSYGQRTREAMKADEEFRKVYQEYMDRYKNVFTMNEHLRKKREAACHSRRHFMDQKEFLRVIATRKTALFYVWAAFFAICFPIFAFKTWRKRLGMGRRIPK